MLFNLSGSAPEVFLDLAGAQGGAAAGSSAAPGGGSRRGGGAAGRATEAAEAAARQHLPALDVSSEGFNVEDAVYAMTTLNNLLRAAPQTYGKGERAPGLAGMLRCGVLRSSVLLVLAPALRGCAPAVCRYAVCAGALTWQPSQHVAASLASPHGCDTCPLPSLHAAVVTARVPQAMLAACDRIVDSRALQEFRALSKNAATISNVALVGAERIAERGGVALVAEMAAHVCPRRGAPTGCSFAQLAAYYCSFRTLVGRNSSPMLSHPVFPLSSPTTCADLHALPHRRGPARRPGNGAPGRRGQRRERRSGPAMRPASVANASCRGGGAAVYVKRPAARAAQRLPCVRDATAVPGEPARPHASAAAATPVAPCCSTLWRLRCGAASCRASASTCCTLKSRCGRWRPPPAPRWAASTRT